MDLTSSSPVGLTTSSPVSLISAPVIDKLDIVIAKQDEILAKLNAKNTNKKKNNIPIGQSLTGLNSTNTTRQVANYSNKRNVAANQSSYYNQQATNNTYRGNTGVTANTNANANTNTRTNTNTNTNTNNTNTNNSNLSGGRRRNHRKTLKKYLKKYRNNTKARVVRKSFLKTLVSNKQKKSRVRRGKKTRGRGRA